MQVQIGKGLTMDVDLSKLNSAVREHVMYIGLRNILMDSHANNTKDNDGDEYVENSRQTATRKLESMYAGEVRTATSRETDPVKVEAMRVATDKVKAAIRKKGKKITDFDLKALAKALLEKYPSIVDEAKKRVEEAKGLDVTVEL